jgi:hypothetical protein
VFSFQCKETLRSFGIPTHSSLLEALLEDGLIRTFDSAAAYEISIFRILRIVDVVFVVADAKVREES